MFPIDLWHLAGVILPHVRDPWPQSIGLGFPFTLSGAGSILAGVLNGEAPQAQRDRAINRAGARGFRVGLTIYVFSLLVQVMSEL